MQFTSPTVANRTPSVLPLLGVSLLPVLLVLTLACLSMSREEETVRLPASAPPLPATFRETPSISVRLSRQGDVTVAGEPIADGALASAWQRQRAALRLLGFEPSQATVVIHADPELPTDKVQQIIETAQEAGFTRCVLRLAGPPSTSGNAPGIKP